MSKARTVFIGLFVVGAASFLIAGIRWRAAGIQSIGELIDLLDFVTETGLVSMDDLLHGTWSAVLLTPVSTAGTYIEGTLSLQYGKTYLDFLASVVPGFLADAIGYVRPIDASRGPSYEMIYGQGGTHAVVVPFMNFRMAGVFLVIALWSFAFAKIERWAMMRRTASKLALLGVIAMAAPHWLWYGEKLIITALIIWLLLSGLYKLQRVRRRPYGKADSSPQAGYTPGSAALRS